jgi:DNA polymerase (family 10)
MARLLRLGEESLFRIRAYERAAQALERLDTDIASLVAEGGLTELKDIGPRLASLIAEIHLTGTSRSLEALRQRYPAGAAELSRVRELGLGRIEKLSRTLGITTLAQLKEACEQGRLRAVKGIGERTERRILDRIRRLEEPRRLLLPEGRQLAEEMRAHLRRAPGAVAVDVAGDLRRSTETVQDLSLVLASDQPRAAAAHARAAPLVSTAETEGAVVRGTLVDGLPFEVRVVSPHARPAELLFATGVSGHVERLQRIASRRGLTLGPTGLSRRGRAGRITLDSEESLYEHLGLPFIAPELREDAGEIEAALAGTLPGDLIITADIRGLVHCHTVYSDGSHTVEQMARAADARGFEYLTITDHSQAASYAGGLPADRLKQQWEEIARVQESVTVRLLRGSEVDILADGALDYPDSILEQLDVVIASVHQRFRLDAPHMTARLTRAMSHPCFKIWGHALGRLLLSRPPIECRVEEVLDVIAGSSRAAVEINGDPRRLDMAPPWIRAVRQRGIPFVISTDAHSMQDYGNVDYGVAMARRGWVRRGEVLNTRTASAFARAVSPSGRAR